MKHRIEHDSLGSIKVPGDKLYGAQTARSLKNFAIGRERFPDDLINALVVVKKSAALANRELKIISSQKAGVIVRACDEILSGKMAGQFPLSVWQTGSGTQTNMNVNEVIANRAIQLSKKSLGSKFIHPNDDVNRGQSSNDVFPTAMHIAAALVIKKRLIPAVAALAAALSQKSKEYKNLVKIGRTHWMDATPVTLGQEFSAYAHQVALAQKKISACLNDLGELALGATAVGTGINAHPRFSVKAISHISKLTGIRFRPAKNKFAAIAAHEALVETSSALKGLAVSLMKIAGDIRFLASGPRSGIGEIILPANEPGSSIMPGKVNPTQCEAVLMVASQVIGNDLTIAIAAGSGNCELNVQKPVIIHNLLQSIDLLADVCRSFSNNCVAGIKPNKERIKENLEKSLMLITALAPSIGYDKAAKLAQKAYREGKTLRRTVLQSGIMNEKDFERLVDPSKMV